MASNERVASNERDIYGPLDYAKLLGPMLLKVVDTIPDGLLRVRFEQNVAQGTEAEVYIEAPRGAHIIIEQAELRNPPDAYGEVYLDTIGGTVALVKGSQGKYYYIDVLSEIGVVPASRITLKAVTTADLATTEYVELVYTGKVVSLL